jgi:hypothetical protein
MKALTNCPTAARRVSPAHTLHHSGKNIAMRSYPRNSPEAAARIVALVLIADGHVCRSEFDALNQLDGAGQLGLEPDGMPLVIQSLCEDLLMGAYAGGSMMACVDDGVMASLMAEVDEPALQRKVLQLAVAAASADRHLADGEAVVIAAARRYWGLGEEAETESRVAADPQAA